jgi:hypothetical protein
MQQCGVQNPNLWVLVVLRHAGMMIMSTNSLGLASAWQGVRGVDHGSPRSGIGKMDPPIRTSGRMPHLALVDAKHVASSDAYALAER